MKAMSWLILSLLFIQGHAQASPIVLSSPDHQIKVTIEGSGAQPTFSVQFKGQRLFDPSALGLEFQKDGKLKHWSLKLTGSRRIESKYTIPVGKVSVVRDLFNEYSVVIKERRPPQRRVDLVFRVYNDGVGFRYEIPLQAAMSDFAITNELTEFATHGDPKMYGLPLPFNTSYEDFYSVGKLSEFPSDKKYGLPTLLGFPNGAWVGITEAALTDYAGMYLAPNGRTLQSRLAPSLADPQVMVTGRAPFASPWRVLLISSNAGKLLESNIISGLNPPSAIADSSWIRPGKVQFPWWNAYTMPSANPNETDPAKKPGLNTWTLKRYIDFCAANGIEYHSFDGFDQAWYGGSIDNPDSTANVTNVIPQLDMPELLRYGKEKGVRARLWMHWRALLNSGDIDVVFATYQKWGIEGVMIDFLDRDDQEMVRFYTKVIQSAARHRLTVNFHGIWKPTGVERTYPNLLSHEGVMGSEYNKWREGGVTPEHELNVAFVRALAGSLDFHPGSFRPILPQDFKPEGGATRSIGTLARQLATYVVLESGSQMLVDHPEAYLANPKAFEFLRQVPVSWDETKFVDGRVGEFITLARRKGKEWYLGTFTDREARRIQVPLQFLGRGEFIVEIYSDVLESRTDAGAIGITRKRVRAGDVLSIDIAPSGGNALRIFPVSAE